MARDNILTKLCPYVLQPWSTYPEVSRTSQNSITYEPVGDMPDLNQNDYQLWAGRTGKWPPTRLVGYCFLGSFSERNSNVCPSSELTTDAQGMVQPFLAGATSPSHGRYAEQSTCGYLRLSQPTLVTVKKENSVADGQVSGDVAFMLPGSRREREWSPSPETSVFSAPNTQVLAGCRSGILIGACDCLVVQLFF